MHIQLIPHYLQEVAILSDSNKVKSEDSVWIISDSDLVSFPKDLLLGVNEAHCLKKLGE